MILLKHLNNVGQPLLLNSLIPKSLLIVEDDDIACQIDPAFSGDMV
jgi:hypothetical protein